jgi:hypothetical protein
MNTQHTNTLEPFFVEAVRIIDSQLGVGYAIRNPKLIAECIHNQTISRGAAEISASLDRIAKALGDRG